MTIPRVLVLLTLAVPGFGQYAGPAILSRGEAPAAMAAPQISFRPYLEVSGIYDTGLAGVQVKNAQGELGTAAAAGVELTGGVSGLHSWRHTKLGLDYQGSVRHYTRKTYFDGADQSLMLGVTHQFSRRAVLSLRESAGMFSRSFGLLGLSQTVPFDPSQSYIPRTDFFDNRTIYLSTQADFTLQKSARLSYNFGGDGFLVRRRSSALYGVTGASARADAQYRLSRRSTAGLAYNYSHYDFTRVFGGTAMHMLMGTYGVRLTRTLELSANAGALRAEMKFVRNEPVDPAITALLGITTGTRISYSVTYLPSFQLRLSQTVQHGVLYLSAGRTVTPGNGLFLTSSMTSADAGYTYTGIRRWSMGVNANYSSSKSMSNIVGTYRGMGGGFTTSRALGRAMHGIASLRARKYDSGTFSNYNRLIYEARIGIGFAPGDVPLRIW